MEKQTKKRTERQTENRTEKQTIERINELELEITALPVGYISRKNIRGKIQQYHQWTENGKKKSKYVDDDAAIELSALIEKRRNLQKELRSLKKSLPKKSIFNRFKTNVLIKDSLKAFVEPVKAFKHRDCFKILENFIKCDGHNDYDDCYGEYDNSYYSSSGKVLILYGLRRTGKTTLIRQAIAAIASLSERDFQKTAFIQVRPGISLGDLNTDLKLFLENGYRNIFIDEVTLAEDFIEGAALFSDIYAASGMKIILSGTDSLGFLFSKSEELYDRCIMLHTTWIPYREFERVLGIKGIDEYIKFGGTMSLGGRHYNNYNNVSMSAMLSSIPSSTSSSDSYSTLSSTFNSKESTDEYIDSAIARNIQHSLKFYQDGGHFRNLAELFEKNELTSAINRVVEDINHRFTIDVLTKDFISHDLGISRRNLRKDRMKPTDILDRIDEKALTEGLRRTLEILNKAEQSVEITDAHRVEIKEYLDLLDLTMDIPTEFIPVKTEQGRKSGQNRQSFRTAISQPGMRYSQAEALVRQLLLDEEFQNISAVDRAWILERILNEIRGRMMEDIVLLETKMANPHKNVFRLQFAVGEFDMVVVDPNEITTEIYEIKHSSERAAEQYKNLIDQEKCSATEFRYGNITRKAVIYRGENAVDGDIEYLNVEDYLKSV